MIRRRSIIYPFLLVILICLGCACLSHKGQTRFLSPLSLKISGSNATARLYSGVIQNSLKKVGIPVQIETLEPNVLFAQLRGGQYQMTSARWVGGNQDPVFLRDLFTTGGAFNRSGYKNPELDVLLNQAVDTPDRQPARTLYEQAQQIVSRDVPILPLWYPANMVVASRSIANIKVDSSGDWTFFRTIQLPPRAEPFVTVFESNPETLDPLRGTDANSERLRQLMFNSLVRRDEHFDYTGELASSIKTAADGLSVAFTLRDNVFFHDNRLLTAADAKYTIEALLASDSRKAVPFYESPAGLAQEGGSQLAPSRISYISSVEAPNPRTLIIHLRKPWLQLLSNLVPIAILEEGSVEVQRDKPNGSGPFRFLRYDASQGVIDMEANERYWEGSPNIKRLRVRVILDSNTLQSELKAGHVDLALVSNLSPDSYKALEQDTSLRIQQFPGVNVVYLGFNTQTEPLRDPRVRQAIAYSIDRQAIISQLLLDQARIAHSILPPESWAYSPGQEYEFAPDRARLILDQAGYQMK